MKKEAIKKGSNLKQLTFLILLFVAGSISAQNLITNGDFESWGTLTDDATSGLKIGVPTGWTASAGNGALKTYQSPETLSNTGYSIFLCNTSTSVSRFVSPNSTTLDPGTYKLSFKSKGSVTWGSITLTESTVSLVSSTATSASTKNLFPTSGIVTEVVPDGTDWTTKEYVFSVSVAGAYRVIFWPTKTKSALIANASNFLLIDDVVLEKYVDNTISSLSELRVRGALVDNFSAPVFNYALTLPNLLSIPKVTALATDSRATVDIVNATNLTGSETERTATVTVTAADGVTKSTYKVILTMTSDVLREGFASVDLPSSFIFSSAGADWRVDASTTNNNGQLWGANSLRPNAGTISTANFIIDSIANCGNLSFYLKFRNADAAAKLIVSYQLTTDAPDQWTELASYTTFPTIYELQTIHINLTPLINIKFDVTKTVAVSPFNIDDILISLKGTNAVPTNYMSNSIIILDSNNSLKIKASELAKFTISSLTGQLVSTDQFYENTELKFTNRGCYIITVEDRTGKKTQKIVRN